MGVGDGVLIFQRIHLIRRIELVCDLGSVWVISIQADRESESARPETRHM